ncbi:hypothetical protein [Natronococcus wangiae]|uniref:hypothetical protein n=1 Tax=Natronococcus wangiae TaxID=3068275 RepID=UPI00273DF691|nr:hypothetical protein [Natronococcus sp. AD5]
MVVGIRWSLSPLAGLERECDEAIALREYGRSHRRASLFRTATIGTSSGRRPSATAA